MTGTLAPTSTDTSPAVSHDRWTYERYLRETAEGEYFTIIAGEKIVSPSPTFNHQNIIGNLYVLLQTWPRSQKAGRVVLAPFDVVFDDDDVSQPDLTIILNHNLSRLHKKHLQGPPDGLVEVISPGSVRVDRHRKRALYARQHVPEYWLISPDNHTVEILQLRGARYETLALLQEDDALESPSLLGFRSPVRELFTE
jgi:Uma2 family endonuclease